MSSWTRIGSSCIVRHAPCFWCSLCSPPLDVNATDRAVLFRLNILIIFSSSCQIFSSLFLLFIIFSNMIPLRQDGGSKNCANHTNSTTNIVVRVLRGVSYRDSIVDDFDFLSLTPEDNFSGSDVESGKSLTPSLWNLIWVIIVIGLVGLVILIFSSIAVKTIKEVILAGAMRFYWVLVWVFPVELFFVGNLLDINQVTYTVIVHMWSKSAFFWIREKMCEKESCEGIENLSTAETKCKAPVFPSNTEEELKQQVNKWCYDRYESDNCYDIQHSAQQKFLVITKAFYGANIANGFFLVVLVSFV
mmetsp:Transcript_33671/g.77690  ORF Transcript_33671/g.77690 Transcript_33671/m.77690 type:complete len:303 (-) Transcript_33671:1046-1954(-)